MNTEHDMCEEALVWSEARRLVLTPILAETLKFTLFLFGEVQNAKCSYLNFLFCTGMGVRGI